MAYTYIPQFFPTGFFEESQLVATLISKKIRLRGSVTKWCLFPTDTPSIGDLISFVRRLYGRLD